MLKVNNFVSNFVSQSTKIVFCTLVVFATFSSSTIATHAQAGLPALPLPGIDPNVGSETGGTTASSVSTSSISSSSSMISSTPTVSENIVAAQYKTTVTPASAADSLATPYYGVDLTVCVQEFDWVDYIAKKKAGQANVNGYKPVGCLRQENFSSNGKRIINKNASGKIVSVNYTNEQTAPKTKYREFNTASGNAVDKAKAVVGELPVLGIFDNAGQKGQATGTFQYDGTVDKSVISVDRTKIESLNNIYTDSELSKLYGANTQRTGAPRIVFTGPDKLTKINNQDYYAGGTCSVNPTTGKMEVRREILKGTSDETEVGPGWDEYYPDPSNPIVGCRWHYPDGTKSEIVLDQNMQIYQFLFVMKYPTAAQCKEFFNIPESQYENRCLQHYRNTYNPLTGKNTGNQVVHTYTYYGMWSDSNTYPYRWGVDGGWKNPDINSPRKTYSANISADDLKKYYGKTEFDKFGEATLRGRFNGFVRGHDGFATYAMD